VLILVLTKSSLIAATILDLSPIPECNLSDKSLETTL
jgi:hypothetical protein